jgi:hypothetical protein
MRISDCGKVLLLGACMLPGHVVWGQSMSPEGREPARLDVALTYSPVLANVTTPSEFGMQGGSLQVQTKLWRGLSVAADVAAFRTADVNNSGTSLDLLTTTFGPRYTWSPRHHRIAFFGEVLIGEAFGLNGLFPSSTRINSTGNSFALQIGGGINLALTRRLSLRALDADWLRTQLPNATTNVQNNSRLGAGIVYRFK